MKRQLQMCHVVEFFVVKVCVMQIPPLVLFGWLVSNPPLIVFDFFNIYVNKKKRRT